MLGGGAARQRGQGTVGLECAQDGVIVWLGAHSVNGTCPHGIVGFVGGNHQGTPQRGGIHEGLSG